MSKNHSVIEIRDLTVTFSRWGQTVTALDLVNLTIPSGQWVMLVGHNGSGKSTLLNAISGRLSPNGGEIMFCSKHINRMSTAEIAENVFHVHQDPLMGTAPKLTLFENLMVADHKAQVEGTSRRELAQKYRELLSPLGLEDRMKQLAQNLSGGERQLIALLIARIRPSSLMLLDEPLAALDPAKAQACIEEIKRLHEDGKTVVQVTHDPYLAANGGDRTVVMAHGNIVYDELSDNRALDDVRNYWTNTMTWRKA